MQKLHWNNQLFLERKENPNVVNDVWCFWQAPLLAGALMPICEVFGSSNVSWTLPKGEELSCHAVFSNAFTLLLRLWRFDHPPLEHVMGDVPPVGSQLSPDYLLLVRNNQLASFGKLPKDRLKGKRLSRNLNFSPEPIFMDSFPKLKCWYQQHQECIASTLSGLVQGTTVHHIVDALLHMMFRKMNRGGQSLTPTSSGSSNSSVSGAEDFSIRLKVPAWDILEATPFVLDAALAACGHGKLSPREFATGLCNFVKLKFPSWEDTINLNWILLVSSFGAYIIFFLIVSCVLFSVCSHDGKPNINPILVH